jgi:hypothetical protein
MPKKLTQEEAERKFRENGFELLGEYINCSIKVKTRCKCGKEFRCFRKYRKYY